MAQASLSASLSKGLLPLGQTPEAGSFHSNSSLRSLGARGLNATRDKWRVSAHLCKCPPGLSEQQPHSSGAVQVSPAAPRAARAVTSLSLGVQVPRGRRRALAGGEQEMCDITGSLDR